MTRPNIDAIEARAAKTTDAGPWEWDGASTDDDGYVYVPQCSYLGNTLIRLEDTYEGSGDDCNFIAHARTDVPALCAYVRELRTERDEAIQRQLLADDTALSYRRAAEAERAAREAAERGLQGAQRKIEELDGYIVELRQRLDGAYTAREAAEARVATLEAALRTMLDSARPHPEEHPTMTAAWRIARAALAAKVPT